MINFAELFAQMGITLENIKDAEAALNEYKNNLKNAEKTSAAENKITAVKAANDAIAAGQIVKGTRVKVMYNKTVVEGIVKNSPSVDNKCLPVSSDAFANKDKFLYVAKANFVSIA